MEKQLSVGGYWLGLISTVLALIFRMTTVFNINTPQMGVSGGNAIGHLSFLTRCRAIFLVVDPELVRTAKP